MAFAGRAREMNRLAGMVDTVRSTGRGRFVLVRGRRQVGKSRLIEEFLGRVDMPSLFFTATKGRATVAELADFARAIGTSGLDPSGSMSGTTFTNWESALAVLARLIDRPTVLVIDEFPYLLDGAPDVEGSFQNAWDRSMQGVAVLLVVVGSDLAVMSALTEYGRPLFGRPTDEMHVLPLDPHETAELAGVSGADAFDAYLVTGGFPNVVSEWQHGATLKAFLNRQLQTSSERLVVTGERVLSAEFLPDSFARQILATIGSGAATFKALGAQTGITAATLNRTLTMLEAKHVISIDRPLSSQPPTETRYRIADTYLAFWLRFIERALPLLERGRSDVASGEILRQWPDYRGRAIEPVIRDAVSRLVPFGDVDAHTIGSYWTRSGSVEVDLVGTSGTAKRTTVSLVGSIKWRERRPFSGADAQQLAVASATVPGVSSDTILVAVSSSGFDVKDIPVRLGPNELLEAWATG